MLGRREDIPEIEKTWVDYQHDIDLKEELKRIIELSNYKDADITTIEGIIELFNEGVKLKHILKMINNKDTIFKVCDPEQASHSDISSLVCLIYFNRCMTSMKEIDCSDYEIYNRIAYISLVGHNDFKLHPLIYDQYFRYKAASHRLTSAIDYGRRLSPSVRRQVVAYMSVMPVDWHADQTRLLHVDTIDMVSSVADDCLDDDCMADHCYRVTALVLSYARDVKSFEVFEGVLERMRVATEARAMQLNMEGLNGFFTNHIVEHYVCAYEERSDGDYEKTIFEFKRLFWYLSCKWAQQANNFPPVIADCLTLLVRYMFLLGICNKFRTRGLLILCSIFINNLGRLSKGELRLRVIWTLGFAIEITGKETVPYIWNLTELSSEHKRILIQHGFSKFFALFSANLAMDEKIRDQAECGDLGQNNPWIYSNEVSESDERNESDERSELDERRRSVEKIDLLDPYETMKRTQKQFYKPIMEEFYLKWSNFLGEISKRDRVSLKLRNRVLKEHYTPLDIVPFDDGEEDLTLSDSESNESLIDLRNQREEENEHLEPQQPTVNTWPLDIKRIPGSSLNSAKLTSTKTYTVTGLGECLTTCEAVDLNMHIRSKAIQAISRQWPCGCTQHNENSEIIFNDISDPYDMSKDWLEVSSASEELHRMRSYMNEWVRKPKIKTTHEENRAFIYCRRHMRVHEMKHGRFVHSGILLQDPNKLDRRVEDYTDLLSLRKGNLALFCRANRKVPSAKLVDLKTKKVILNIGGLAGNPVHRPMNVNKLEEHMLYRGNKIYFLRQDHINKSCLVVYSPFNRTIMPLYIRRLKYEEAIFGHDTSSFYIQSTCFGDGRLAVATSDHRIVVFSIDGVKATQTHMLTLGVDVRIKHMQYVSGHQILCQTDITGVTYDRLPMLYENRLAIIDVDRGSMVIVKGHIASLCRNGCGDGELKRGTLRDDFDTPGYLNFCYDERDDEISKEISESLKPMDMLGKDTVITIGKMTFDGKVPIRLIPKTNDHSFTLPRDCTYHILDITKLTSDTINKE